jgi:hypothetical protein
MGYTIGMLMGQLAALTYWHIFMTGSVKRILVTAFSRKLRLKNLNRHNMPHLILCLIQHLKVPFMRILAALIRENMGKPK